MAESFQFELVSPERLLVSEQVESVVIPAADGEMTVMARHAPVMTTVKAGVVTVKSASGNEERYVVFGGFADILPTGCTLLAEAAMPLSEVSQATLQKRIEAAQAEIADVTSDEHKTKLELYLAELTRLGGVIAPA